MANARELKGLKLVGTMVCHRRQGGIDYLRFQTNETVRHAPGGGTD